MTEVASRLASIAAEPTSTRADSYAAVLHSLLSTPRSALSGDALRTALAQFLDAAVFADANSTGGGLVVGRQVLQTFDEAMAAQSSHTDDERAGKAEDPAIWDPEVRRSVLEDALEKVQPRVLSFEEQASSLRLHLADLLEASEDWATAASVLQGIPLDSGRRSLSETYKLRTHVRIVRLLLEADDAVGADVSLKRASLVLHAVPGATPVLPGSQAQSTDPKVLEEGKHLGLLYRLCQARIYDAQRRFAEAASRFHELSYVTEIDEGERTQMLSSAVTAAILSPAGPQRSRSLATLVRDERTSSLAQHKILQRVFLDQIVRTDEVAAFAQLLAPHQRAVLPPSANERALAAAEASDGDVEMGAPSGPPVSTRAGPSTVLDRAFMEHNVLAASKIYANVTFASLGALLDLSPAGAEALVRRMATDKRIKAELDGVEGIVTFFESRSGAAEAGTAGGLGDVEPAPDTGVQDEAGWAARWDAQIARSLTNLEATCSHLQAIKQKVVVAAA